MMNIVACASDNYTMQCGVMFYSVCKNNAEEDIAFYVITDDGFSEQHKSEIRQTVESFSNKKVFFVQVTDEQIDKFISFENSYYTRHVFYRLLMAELLPQEVEKVLYLDCDIIVRHSLRDLWNVDISKYAVGCVRDGLEAEIEKFNRLGYSYDKGYFNSGVLLANLQYWRRTDAKNRFMNYIKQNAQAIRYPDQDVLNSVFVDEKLFLPFKYNAQSALLYKHQYLQIDYPKYKDSIDEAVKDPVILHLSGARPWMKGNEKEHPYSIEFFKYKKLTLWRDVPQIKKTTVLSRKRYIKMLMIIYIRKALHFVGIGSGVIDKYNRTLRLS